MFKTHFLFRIAEEKHSQLAIHERCFIICNHKVHKCLIVLSVHKFRYIYNYVGTYTTTWFLAQTFTLHIPYTWSIKWTFWNERHVGTATSMCWSECIHKFVWIQQNRVTIASQLLTMWWYEANTYSYRYTYYMERAEEERLFNMYRTVAYPTWYANKQHATPQPTTDRVEV